MKINYFSENKQPTRMTNVENRMRTIYLKSLDRINEIIDNPNASEAELNELRELRIVNNQLEPLCGELSFEMKLRDSGYVGKLADFD